MRAWGRGELARTRKEQLQEVLKRKLDLGLDMTQEDGFAIVQVSGFVTTRVLEPEGLATPLPLPLFQMKNRAQGGSTTCP